MLRAAGKRARRGEERGGRARCSDVAALSCSRLRQALPVILGLSLASLAYPGLGAQPKESGPSGTGRGWRDGPVRYLLTDEEYSRFGKLSTEEARSAFVERFWRRLDPDPSTPGNEYRDRFEKLVADADRLWGAEGWRTDRGRVLILLGEPASTRRAGGDPHSVVREIWTYERRSGGAHGPVEIVFYGDRAGRFHLDPAEADNLDAARGWADFPSSPGDLHSLRLIRTFSAPFADLSSFFRVLVPPGRDRGSRMGLSLEPEERRPNATRTAKAEGDRPPSPMGDDGVFFFQTADGRILALAALEFRPDVRLRSAADPPASASDYDGFVWLIRQGPSRGPRPREAAVWLERREERNETGRILFTGKVRVDPGRYVLRYLVGDARGQTLALREKEIDVPDLSPGEFSASSVVPAERFGPAPTGGPTPYSVGSEEVVPQPGRRFERDGPMRVYLQVYGAATDPASGTPRVEVTFTFDRAVRGRFHPYGRPLSYHGVAGASLGLTLPVAGWPRGDYRVVVDLRDAVSGALASAEGFFHVAD